MSWFIFLGAAVGVREGYHLGFDVLQAYAPVWLAGLFATVSDLVVIIFGLPWPGMAGC